MYKVDREKIFVNIASLVALLKNGLSPVLSISI